MRKILVLFLFLPLFALAQDMDTSANRIVVTEDVNECVQKIHDNPDAIKLLMSVIMSDRSKMESLRNELMKDPAFMQMMRDARSEMMKNDGMHEDMHHNREGMQEDQQDMQHQNENDHQQQNESDDYEQQQMEEEGFETQQSDTTGVR